MCASDVWGWGWGHADCGSLVSKSPPLDDWSATGISKPWRTIACWAIDFNDIPSVETFPPGPLSVATNWDCWACCCGNGGGGGPEFGSGEAALLVEDGGEADAVLWCSIKEVFKDPSTVFICTEGLAEDATVFCDTDWFDIDVGTELMANADTTVATLGNIWLGWDCDDRAPEPSLWWVDWFCCEVDVANCRMETGPKLGPVDGPFSFTCAVKKVTKI